METWVNSSSNRNVLCSSRLVLTLLRAWTAVYFLLLPLFFFVFYIGYKQWKRRRSAASHSDVFTFHIISLEVLNMAAACFYNAGVESGVFELQQTGDDVYSVAMMGQMFIHGLTCVERYLAVLHPVVYLQLKKRGGVRIRNVSVALVWILSVVSVCLKYTSVFSREYSVRCILIWAFFSVSLVSFCSVSVLCALIRPGPGEGGGDLRRVDQSKRRAFFTMMAITGVLLLRLVILVVAYLLSSSGLLDFDDACLFSMTAAWFNFPSSLVLPLMFLHRAGKLPKACFIN